MYELMEKMVKRITRKRFQVIGTVMVMTYTFSGIHFSIPLFLNDVFKRLNTNGSTHKASCLDMENTEHDEAANPTISNSPNVGNKDKAKRQTNQSNDVEFKLILLGATGSGKSSAGNVFLQKHGNNEGFKTSCFAKSQTIQSSSKSVIQAIKFNNDRKMYKIDIIDTPAISDTGLSKENVKIQIEKAKELSKPGPHAFLFCVPANAITNYYTDIIDSYIPFFDGKIYDSTIVVFTRYDQLLSENAPEVDLKGNMEQNNTLKKIKHHITLSDKLSIDEKVQKLEEVVRIVIKIENQERGTAEF